MTSTTRVPWLDERESRLWRDWLHTQARLHLAIQRDLRSGSELSEADFEVLVHLTESERGLRMSELARGLQWDRSRVSHLVGRMERRGLVRRDVCAEDGRGAVVAATDEGRAAIEKAAPGHVVTVRREFLDRLDDDDRAALARILEKVVDPA